MKKMLSLALLLVVTAVPLCSALADAAYGWEDGQFHIEDLDWVLALPEGAVAATDAEIDAANESPPFPSKEKIICMMTVPETGVFCTIGIRRFAAPEDVSMYNLFYMFEMVDALGLDSGRTTMGDETLCGVASCRLAYPQEGTKTTVTLVPCGSDAYVVTVTVPDTEEGARDAFVAELTAPTMGL